MVEKPTIEQLFGQLIQLDSAAERRQFLREDDKSPEDREKLKKLLAAYENSGSFLNLDDSADQTTYRTADLIGTEIGPYKLLQKIGEGGMGVVYMAEQKEPVRRRVALKIIKPGMDSKQILARFEAERQALAMMDHPNIAKVLEAGTTDIGQPFFVMELVKGIPITDFCDNHRLPTVERLKLFIEVCQAVQHAHQKGVIHRDIKPSNVLVARFDDKPVIKVIDFGVAKAASQDLTDRTMFTQFGQVVGTLEYMSPEQAHLNQLDVDTRSDIYSLGVLLYELLTGSTPFTKDRLQTAAFDEVLRIIREEDPPRPSVRLSTLGEDANDVCQNRNADLSALGRGFRGDVDLIVMKALDKDRSRRYESATGFASDLQRYLDGEPISARPASALYVMRKLTQRHRSAVVTGMLIFIALAVGLLASSWYAIEARRNLHALQEATFRRMFYESVARPEGLDSASTPHESVLTPAQQDALKGLRAFFDERYQDAAALLSKASPSPMVLAVLVWCEIGLADDRASETTLQTLKKLEAEADLSPEDHIMIALLYSWLRPEEARDHISEARKSGEVGILGLAVQGLVRANYGLQSAGDNSLTATREAVNLLEIASGFSDDNPMISEFLIFANNSAHRAALDAGEVDVAKDFLKRAGTLCRDRQAKPTYNSVHTLILQNKHAEALDEYEALIHESPGGEMCCFAALACLCGEQERAMKALKLAPKSFYSQMATNFLHASVTQHEREICEWAEDVFNSKHDSDARIWVLQMLSMAGVNDKHVQAIASRIEKDTIDHLYPIEVIEFYSKPLPQDFSFINVSRPSVRNNLKFAAGVRLHNQGRLEDAMAVLLEIEHRLPVLDGIWAKFYVKSIREKLSRERG